MAKYRIVVTDIFVKDGQGIWDGKLELRGRFTANGVQVFYPSPSAHVALSPGEHCLTQLTVAVVENQASVPINAEFWELEPGGGQGDTDYGSTTGAIKIAQGQMQTTLEVNIKADGRFENDGIVTVKFQAVEIVPLPPVVHGTYEIRLCEIDVVRDQRTGSGINFEGLLELRIRFTTDNTVVWYPSSSSHFLAEQGKTITPGIILKTVKDVGGVAMKVDLWELEPHGLQGGTDFGSATGILNLNVGSLTLIVTTSADNWKEKSAIVTFRFVATKMLEIPNVDKNRFPTMEVPIEIELPKTDISGLSREPNKLDSGRNR